MRPPAIALEARRRDPTEQGGGYQIKIRGCHEKCIAGGTLSEKQPSPETGAQDVVDHEVVAEDEQKSQCVEHPADEHAIFGQVSHGANKLAFAAAVYKVDEG